MSRGSKPLTLRSLTGRAVAVPMTRPLGTSVETINVASLLLIDLATDEGITGRAYAFCYRPSIARAAEAVIEDLSECSARRSRRSGGACSANAAPS